MSEPARANAAAGVVAGTGKVMRRPSSSTLTTGVGSAAGGAGSAMAAGAAAGVVGGDRRIRVGGSRDRLRRYLGLGGRDVRRARPQPLPRPPPRVDRRAGRARARARRAPARRPPALRWPPPSPAARRRGRSRRPPGSRGRRSRAAARRARRAPRRYRSASDAPRFPAPRRAGRSGSSARRASNRIAMRPSSTRDFDRGALAARRRSAGRDPAARRRARAWGEARSRAGPPARSRIRASAARARRARSANDVLRQPGREAAPGFGKQVERTRSRRRQHARREILRQRHAQAGPVGIAPHHGDVRRGPSSPMRSSRTSTGSSKAMTRTPFSARAETVTGREKSRRMRPNPASSTARTRSSGRSLAGS